MNGLNAATSAPALALSKQALGCSSEPMSGDALNVSSRPQLSSAKTVVSKRNSTAKHWGSMNTVPTHSTDRSFMTKATTLCDGFSHACNLEKINEPTRPKLPQAILIPSKPLNPAVGPALPPGINHRHHTAQEHA